MVDGLARSIYLQQEVDYALLQGLITLIDNAYEKGQRDKVNEIKQVLTVGK